MPDDVAVENCLFQFLALLARAGFEDLIDQPGPYRPEEPVWVARLS